MRYKYGQIIFKTLKMSWFLGLNMYFFFFTLFLSCWLSLEGGLLYAFVGPAAVIVLVSSLIVFVQWSASLSVR